MSLEIEGALEVDMEQKDFQKLGNAQGLFSIIEIGPVCSKAKGFLYFFWGGGCRIWHLQAIHFATAFLGI